MIRSARAIPSVVWLVLAVHLGLAAAYSVLLPTWRGPDEPHHVDLVLRAADGQAYPEWDDASISVAVNETLDRVGFYQGSHHLERATAPPRAARLPFDDDHLDHDSPAPNQIAQHPPSYSYAVGGVLRVAEAVVPGRAGFDATVGGLRLLNALLVAVASPCAFLAARRLGAREPAAVAAAMVPLAVPQWAAIGGSVNNDNLQTAQMAVLAVFLAHLATGDGSRRTVLGAGGVAGLGMWVKAFGLLGPLWVALACVVGAGRDRVEGLRRAALATVVAVAVGGWWWLHNLLADGELQPSVLLLPDAPDGFSPDPWWWAKRFVPWMARRFWGWFGWFDVKMPGPVVFGASIVVLGLVVVGVAAGPRRRAAAVLAVGTVLLLAASAQFAWGGYVASGQTPSIQGRYLFPALPALAAVAMVGLDRLLGRRGSLAPLLVWGAATGLQLVAGLVLVPWYWGAADAGPLERLGALGAWSPWPGPATAALLLVAAVGWLVLGAVALRRARRPEPLVAS